MNTFGGIGKQLASCLVLALLITACAQEASAPESSNASTPDSSSASAPLGDISAAELHTRLVDNTAPVILDVRSEGEFAEGHLRGAINIVHSDFIDAPDAAADTLAIQQDTEVVVHCASGRRAAIVTQALAEQGYTNVRHLTGDYQGWLAAGYEVE